MDVFVGFLAVRVVMKDGSERMQVTKEEWKKKCIGGYTQTSFPLHPAVWIRLSDACRNAPGYAPLAIVRLLPLVDAAYFRCGGGIKKP